METRKRTPLKAHFADEEEEDYDSEDLVPAAPKVQSNPLTLATISQLVDIIRAHEYAYPFNEPVDAEGLGLFDYHTIIKKPIDLGTIRKSLDMNRYKSPKELLSDVNLVWKNAMTYNLKGSSIWNLAKALKDEWNKLLSNARKGMLPPSTPGEICAVCRAVKPGEILICCDGNCGRDYHLGCVGLTEEPTSDRWLCPSCTARENQQQQHNVQQPIKSPQPKLPQPVQQKPTQPTVTTPPPQVISINNNNGISQQQPQQVPLTSMGVANVGTVITAPQATTGTSLQSKIKAILDSLEDLTDPTGRQIAELFLELPSRELYPDYYFVIKNPISFNEVHETDYTSVAQFQQDMQTIFTNAQTYNVPLSLVYEDSLKLQRTFYLLLQQHFPQEFSAFAEQARAAAENGKQKRGRPSSTKKQNGGSIPNSPAVTSPISSGPIPQSPANEDEQDSDRQTKRRRKSLRKDLNIETLISNGDEDMEELASEEATPNQTPVQGTPTPQQPVKPPSQFEGFKSIYEELSDEEDEESSGKKVKVFPKEIPFEHPDTKGKPIEKILGDRPKKSETKQEQQEVTTPPDQAQPAVEYEYFIKWKGKSYLHAEWIDQSVLASSPKGKQRIKKYWQKKQEKEQLEERDILDGEYFPPDYCEVDRVLASHQVVEDGKPKTFYLIKWKGIPHTEATWEKPEEFKDDQKVAEFVRFNQPPQMLGPPWPGPMPGKKWIRLDKSPSFKNGNTVRPYQLEGLNWLVFSWYERRSSILADEMGLGKTVQSISFLWYLKHMEGIRGPFLVLAPLSTIGHWIREFEEWTDMNVVLYQGNRANREITRNYEFYFNVGGQPNTKGPLKFNVLLTTYEMILGDDWQELAQIHWKALVTDEAHRLKNQGSKLLQNLKQFKSDHRVLLTGTPLQNNTQELWSLLNFIEPNKFSSLAEFTSQFGTLQDSEQVTKLHGVLRPHLLRRLKEDVEKSIPPKEETLVEVELTSLQKRYYRAMLEKNRDFLNKGCTNKNVPNLINIMMQLRKVCNHPFLINGVEEKETPAMTTDEYFKVLINSSGKLVLLDKLLPRLKEGGHKVLIFSQMIKVLDLLETYLRYRGYIYERLDGSVRGNERQASIDRFCKPGSDRFAFLLCTRAGGVGINLTSADTVIIYDSDWNPQNDIQAQARCHRIGQTQEVKVYRLITARTYERHMFETSSKKLGLDQAVLHDMGSPISTQGGRTALDKKEIDTLLKYGAYDLFKEEDKEGEKKFFEDDIDQILNRSSKVVWKDATEGGKVPSSFSKASFQSSSAEPEIDINDPNFWELVLPEAKTAKKLLEKLEKGDLISSKEKRQLFMIDLEELSFEVLGAFKAGKFDEVAQPRNYLMKAFEILKDNIDVFTEEETRKILTWGEQVTKPTRRERRARFGDLMLEESPASSTAASRFKPPKRDRRDHKPTPPPQSTEARPWTDYERRAFHNAFMSFGLDRWDEIRQKAGLTAFGEDELRSYAELLIKQCIVYCEEGDRQVFIEYLSGLLSLDETMQMELVAQSDFGRLIKRRVKSWARQLRILQKVREALGDHNSFEEFEIPNINRPLTTWWTAEHDRALLAGLLKHGAGEWEAIRLDPELPFYAHKEEMEKAEGDRKKKKPDASPEDGEDREEEQEEEEPVPEELPQADITETPTTTVTESAAVTTAAETPSEATPTPAVEPSTEEQGQEVGTSTPTSNAPSIALSKAKQGKFKVSAAWPLSRTLEAHCKLLLESIVRYYAANDKARLKLQKKMEKQWIKKRMKEDRDREWSKREQTDFRIAVLAYGAGQWDVIRAKAGLRKTNEQIQDYFEYLMDQCKKIADEADRLAQIAPRVIEEKYDELEESIPGVTSEKKKKKPLQQPEPKGEGVVTAGMAKKLLKRVKLFDDMRKTLNHPELADKLKSIDRFGLPGWWNPPIHDVFLLQNALRYGIGTKEWLTLLDDHDCPLYFNSSGKPDYKKQKDHYLREFVKDKMDLQNRLEYITLFVLDPVSAMILKKRKKGKDVLNPDALTYLYTRSNRRRGEDGDGGDEPFDLDMLPPKMRLMSAKMSAKDVERDAEGKPLLPIMAKGSTIINLGTIVYDRPAYHSRNYIWPVGFKSSRKLPSLKTHGEYVPYISEILDGGAAPIFQVSPSDDPSIVFSHSTSSGVWCEALKAIKKRQNISVSGPEMFGFSDPTVKMLIQELPNAKKCSQYQWKDFSGADIGEGTDDTATSPVSTPIKSEAPETPSSTTATPVAVKSENTSTPSVVFRGLSTGSDSEDDDDEDDPMQTTETPQPLPRGGLVNSISPEDEDEDMDDEPSFPPRAPAVTTSITPMDEEEEDDAALLQKVNNYSRNYYNKDDAKDDSDEHNQ